MTKEHCEEHCGGADFEYSPYSSSSSSSAIAELIISEPNPGVFPRKPRNTFRILDPLCLRPAMKLSIIHTYTIYVYTFMRITLATVQCGEIISRIYFPDDLRDVNRILFLDRWASIRSVCRNKIVPRPSFRIAEE